MTVCSVTRSKVKVKVTSPHFQRLSSFPFIMGLANDHRFLHYGTIPKPYWDRIFIFILVFVSCNFEVGSK